MLAGLGSYTPSPILTVQVVQAAEVPVWSIDNAHAFIDLYATKYNVDSELLYKTIDCESRLDPSARGDHGLARGLAQIRSDYFPGVTDKQADNPEFAIDFIAKAFSEGHANWWSCYRQIINNSLQNE